MGRPEEHPAPAETSAPDLRSASSGSHCAPHAGSGVASDPEVEGQGWGNAPSARREEIEAPGKSEALTNETAERGTN